MSNNTPKFTKEDLDKLLNCSDKLKSTFDIFRTATKKLNDEREKIKKQAAGIPTSMSASVYQRNIQNKKALNKANSVIDNLVKEFSVDISNINKNIGVLNSQTIYQNRISDLINYYKKNISDDEKEIAKKESEVAVANRMTTFYNKSSENANSAKNFISVLYWPLLIFSCIMLLYNVMNIPGYFSDKYMFVKNSFKHLKNAITKRKKNISSKKLTELLNKKPINKVKNPLSQTKINQIMQGPKNINRASGVMRNSFNFTGGAKYSTHPWLLIIKVLILIPLIIYIIELIMPYINKLILPKLSLIH